jgi:hypothetical protein
MIRVGAGGWRRWGVVAHNSRGKVFHEVLFAWGWSWMVA